ncbi:MAG: hypothetical protein COU51_01995 [Parcubacteria group bacterium CG10_big_fil_rev_8_21_14_0_10_36_14]|nr:MAG: hypothetical protein COU51_01995 [Parcubacteria group bacterium CG10_big_fil_rev_8_21_14_0_10_36_14]
MPAKKTKIPKKIEKKSAAYPQKKLDKKSVSVKKAASSIVEEKSLVKKKIKRKVRSIDDLLDKKNIKKRIKKNIAEELLKSKKNLKAKIYTSPYAYIYAEYLRGAKYEKQLRTIENRLTDLGISGRVHRLSQFKNLKELIEEDTRRGINTIVVVGGDDIIKESIRVAAELDVTLGIIPLGGGGYHIAEALGIPEGVSACEILSQRIIDKIDIGKINGKPFVSRLYISNQRVPLFCNKKYEVMSPGGDVAIYNLNLNTEDKTIPKINPKDGQLEILVKPKKKLGIFKKEKSQESLFFANRIDIKSGIAFSIFVDGIKNFYKEVEIKLVLQGLRLIVGKGRKI